MLIFCILPVGEVYVVTVLAPYVIPLHLPCILKPCPNHVRALVKPCPNCVQIMSPCAHAPIGVIDQTSI